MRVVIMARGWLDEEAVRERVRALPPDSEILTPGGAGVHAWAADEASKMGMHCKAEPVPERLHRRLGTDAASMHYGNLARAADRLIVYWDGSNELIYGALCPAGAAGKFVEEYKP